MKLYRLWIPQVNTHGDCFDKLCNKCQKKISKIVKNKLVLPTQLHIIISDDGVTITFGYSSYGSIATAEVSFCESCATNFKKWLDENTLQISNESIELWISDIDEMEVQKP